MTIKRIGATKKYADNWALAFGQNSRTGPKTETAKGAAAPQKKALQKKAPQKKAAQKKAAQKKSSAAKSSPAQSK